MSELSEAITQLQKLKSQQAVLDQAYSIIAKRYRGKRFHTVWTAARFWGKSPEQLWGRPGFLDCLHQNQLLSYLLLGSKHFNKSDIKHSWTLYWGFSPHQHLKVRLSDGSVVSVDPWSASYGIGLGDYARWFHTRD